MTAFLVSVALTLIPQLYTALTLRQLSSLSANERKETESSCGGVLTREQGG